MASATKAARGDEGWTWLYTGREQGPMAWWGFWFGKRHGPRTRKGDPRKLKGGTAVLLCLKRQFADLRYGLYITARLPRWWWWWWWWWEIARSIVRASLPFADLARGPIGASPDSVHSHHSSLQRSLPSTPPCRANPGPFASPPAGRQMRFLCSSLLVCGRDDLLSRYSRIQISSCRARERASERDLAELPVRFADFSTDFVLPPSLCRLFSSPLRPPTPSTLDSLPISLSSVPSCAPNPLTAFAIATGS
jgi:hypothetical protein